MGKISGTVVSPVAAVRRLYEALCCSNTEARPVYLDTTNSLPSLALCRARTAHLGSDIHSHDTLCFAGCCLPALTGLKPVENPICHEASNSPLGLGRKRVHHTQHQMQGPPRVSRLSSRESSSSSLVVMYVKGGNVPSGPGKPMRWLRATSGVSGCIGPAYRCLLDDPRSSPSNTERCEGVRAAASI